jgi:hypothetical protein
MIVALLLMAAAAAGINLGDSCEQALQLLRNQEGLRIEATNVLHRGDQEVLIYTMTKGKKKTAILGCALDPRETIF